MSLYTPQKVYLPLSQKLPLGAPLHAAIARYSEEENWAGLAAQRQAIFQIYGPTSTGMTTMQSWPTEVWDPEHAGMGATYGVTWLTLSDLHHLAVGRTPLVCLALAQNQLLVGVTLSTTIRHIKREDG